MFAVMPPPPPPAPPKARQACAFVVACTASARGGVSVIQNKYLLRAAATPATRLRLCAWFSTIARAARQKGNYYHDDTWSMKYLPKFKWHHLTERIGELCPPRTPV